MRARVDRVLAKSRAEAAISRDQIHYFAMTRSSSILGSPRGSVDGDAAKLAALGPADWDAASARLIAGLPALRARLAGPGVAAQRLPGAAPGSARGGGQPDRGALGGPSRTGSVTSCAEAETRRCSRCTSPSRRVPPASRRAYPGSPISCIAWSRARRPFTIGRVSRTGSRGSGRASRRSTTLRFRSTTTTRRRNSRGCVSRFRPGSGVKRSGFSPRWFDSRR